MAKLTKKQQEARKRLCLALDDVKSLKEAKSIIKQLSPYVGIFKIGKETYTKFGPNIVKLINKNKSKVFLDLKYHDIPNTVELASKAAADLGVYMFNVHASGGLEMMKAAVRGARASRKKAKVIAVTVLTSIDKKMMNKELKVKGKIEKQVLRLAKLAQKAKLDGIVCSSADLRSIRKKLPKDFMYVTPGIKGSAGVEKDQKRVNAAGKAIRDGATILVVGRAITKAKNKQKAAIEILEDMAKYL